MAAVGNESLLVQVIRQHKLLCGRLTCLGAALPGQLCPVLQVVCAGARVGNLELHQAELLFKVLDLSAAVG